MMFVEVLLVIALLLGFVIGTWWSQNKAGGIAQLRAQRDFTRKEAAALRERLDRTRAQRDRADVQVQRAIVAIREVTASSVAAHPSSQPASPSLRLVHGDGA